MRSWVLAVLALLVALARAPAASPADEEGLVWQSWSPALFDRARAEQHLVILDLEAVWCH